MGVDLGTTFTLKALVSKSWVAWEMSPAGEMAQAALWVFPPQGTELEAVLETLTQEVMPNVRAALD